MPHNPHKCSASCAVLEVVTPSGVEVVSVDTVAGKVVKKCVFEQHIFVVPTTPDDPVAPDNPPSPNDHTDNNRPSRSSSVCVSHARGFCI
jgi:hypothetical protein